MNGDNDRRDRPGKKSFSVREDGEALFARKEPTTKYSIKLS
jgi:hypothetical protein